MMSAALSLLFFPSESVLSVTLYFCNQDVGEGVNHYVDAVFYVISCKLYGHWLKLKRKP